MQSSCFQGNASAVKTLIKKGGIISDIEDDTEQKLKEMFLLSLAEKINISLNDVNGARVWDIIENFTKQRMYTRFQFPGVDSNHLQWLM